ncbi:MAG TPA: hypothetical protein VE338_06925 [Ktedonobacterales bacterium]|jgi:nitroreductase|nr:hypothetical protein [Ktedonobacterales bacterium]
MTTQQDNNDTTTTKAVATPIFKMPPNPDEKFAEAIKALRQAYSSLNQAAWRCHEIASKRVSAETAAWDGQYDGAADQLARMVSYIETETRRLRKVVKQHAADIEEDGE